MMLLSAVAAVAAAVAAAAVVGRPLAGWLSKDLIAEEDLGKKQSHQNQEKLR